MCEKPKTIYCGQTNNDGAKAQPPVNLKNIKFNNDELNALVRITV